jgi:hypothetical protein
LFGEVEKPCGTILVAVVKPKSPFFMGGSEGVSPKSQNWFVLKHEIFPRDWFAE